MQVGVQDEAAGLPEHSAALEVSVDGFLHRAVLRSLVEPVLVLAEDAPEGLVSADGMGFEGDAVELLVESQDVRRGLQDLQEAGVEKPA